MSTSKGRLPIDLLIEKYRTVTGPTVFRLDVLADLEWLRRSMPWSNANAIPAEDR